MPRKSLGARKYLQPPRYHKKTGALAEPSSWVIRDGNAFVRTGCPPEDVAGAERALQAYLAEKHQIDRRPDRRAADIAIADVMNIYAQDIVSKHARPQETNARLKTLDAFWQDRSLADITGATCRAYARARPSQASARRELEDLRSAVNHHRKEGYCTEVITVVLPERSESRDRWLTRKEAASLIRAAYRYREMQKGHATGRRSRRHVARFILVGLYTGTRAAAICSASFTAGPGRGYLDLDRGVFYRKRQGDKETKKRQPPVRLHPRLLAHLRRWHSRPEPPVDRNAEQAPRMIAQDYAVEFCGQPIGKINKAFKRAALDANLAIDAEGEKTDVSPHCLRHTAATWGMQDGAEVNKLAGMLGMTVEMLERVYGHHHPDFQKDVAETISGDRARSHRIAQKRAKQTGTEPNKDETGSKEAQGERA